VANFSATTQGDLTTAIAGSLSGSISSLAKTRNEAKDNENLEESTPGSLFLKALGTPFGGKTFNDTIGTENPKTGGANALGVQKPQISSSSSPTLNSSEIRKATSEFVANNPGIVVSDKDLKEHVVKAFGGAILPKLIQAEGRVNNLENAVSALSGNLVNTQTLISQSNDILSSKFDQLIGIFGQQLEFQQKIKDKAEYDKKANELALKKDVSKVSSFIKTATNTGGSSIDIAGLLTLSRNKKLKSILDFLGNLTPKRKGVSPIRALLGGSQGVRQLLRSKKSKELQNRLMSAVYRSTKNPLNPVKLSNKFGQGAKRAKSYALKSEKAQKLADLLGVNVTRVADELRLGGLAALEDMYKMGMLDPREFAETKKAAQSILKDTVRDFDPPPSADDKLMREIAEDRDEFVKRRSIEPNKAKVSKSGSLTKAKNTASKVGKKFSSRAGATALTKPSLGARLFGKGGKLVPGLGAGIAFSEAAFRWASGDKVGAMMSVGSAIPILGWGFTAFDIARDLGFDPLDTLPKDDQYERGTNLTKPGTAVLHGTEAVIGSKDREDVATSYVEAMDKIGSSIVSSAMSVANATGDGQLVASEIKRAGLDYNIDVLPLSTDIGRVKNTADSSAVSGTSNENPLQKMISSLFTDKKRGRQSPRGMFNLENDIRTRNAPITIPEYDLDHNEPNSAVRMGENYYKTTADGNLGDKITFEEAQRIILSKLPQRSPVRNTPIGGTGQYGPNRRAQGNDHEALDTNLKIGTPSDPDGQHTGLNMTLPGGVGTPIYAPIDLTYRSRGTDGNPSVGLDGNPNIRPSMMGKGFGYYGAYYFVKDGKEYEVLLGHFKSMPYRGQKDGDKIPKGTLLGYQGASGNTDNGGAGGLRRYGGPAYPHISLHVNGIGFRASTDVLDWFAKKIPGASAAPDGNDGGGGPKPTTKREEALLDTISYAEGTTDSYGTIFGGRVIPELANGELTVQEVYDMMMTGEVRGRTAGYATGSYATGRYQFMPDTIDDVVNKYKVLKWTDKFTPKAQDRAILSRIANFRGVTDAMLKSEGLSNRVLDMLSGEFASFPQYDGSSMYNQPVKSQDKLRQIYQKNLESIPTTPEGIQRQIERNQWLRDNDPVNFFGSNTPTNSSAKNLQLASSQTEESLEGPQVALQVVYINQTAVISKSTASSSSSSRKSDMTNLYRMASLA
tara:strand:- start:8703 stop:12257 length:3555 start_codon:yes stop_codon:yes gene_type:complete